MAENWVRSLQAGLGHVVGAVAESVRGRRGDLVLLSLGGDTVAVVDVITGGVRTLPAAEAWREGWTDDPVTLIECAKASEAVVADLLRQGGAVPRERVDLAVGMGARWAGHTKKTPDEEKESRRMAREDKRIGSMSGADDTLPDAKPKAWSVAQLRKKTPLEPGVIADQYAGGDRDRADAMVKGMMRRFNGSPSFRRKVLAKGEDGAAGRDFLHDYFKDQEAKGYPDAKMPGSKTSAFGSLKDGEVVVVAGKPADDIEAAHENAAMIGASRAESGKSMGMAINIFAQGDISRAERVWRQFEKQDEEYAELAKQMAPAIRKVLEHEFKGDPAVAKQGGVPGFEYSKEQRDAAKVRERDARQAMKSAKTAAEASKAEEARDAERENITKWRRVLEMAAVVSRAEKGWKRPKTVKEAWEQAQAKKAEKAIAAGADSFEGYELAVGMGKRWEGHQKGEEVRSGKLGADAAAKKQEEVKAATVAGKGWEAFRDLKDPEKILAALYAGLEDSNFHTLNKQIGKLSAAPGSYGAPRDYGDAVAMAVGVGSAHGREWGGYEVADDAIRGLKAAGHTVLAQQVADLVEIERKRNEALEAELPAKLRPLLKLNPDAKVATKQEADAKATKARDAEAMKPKEGYVRLVPAASALDTPRKIKGTLRSGGDENVVTVPYGREKALGKKANIEKYIRSGRDVTIHGVGSGTGSIEDFVPGSTLYYRYKNMQQIASMKVPNETVPWDGTVDPKDAPKGAKQAAADDALLSRFRKNLSAGAERWLAAR
jgi:hypothetical protein